MPWSNSQGIFLLVEYLAKSNHNTNICNKHITRQDRQDTTKQRTKKLPYIQQAKDSKD